MLRKYPNSFAAICSLITGSNSKRLLGRWAGLIHENGQRLQFFAFLHVHISPILFITTKYPTHCQIRMLYFILSPIKQKQLSHILGVADFYEFLRLNSTKGLDQGY